MFSIQTDHLTTIFEFIPCLLLIFIIEFMKIKEGIQFYMFINIISLILSFPIGIILGYFFKYYQINISELAFIFYSIIIFYFTYYICSHFWYKVIDLVTKYIEIILRYDNVKISEIKKQESKEKSNTCSTSEDNSKDNSNNCSTCEDNSKVDSNNSSTSEDNSNNSTNSTNSSKSEDNSNNIFCNICHASDSVLIIKDKNRRVNSTCGICDFNMCHSCFLSYNKRTCPHCAKERAMLNPYLLTDEDYIELSVGVFVFFFNKQLYG